MHDFGDKCPVFKWSALSRDQTIRKLDKKESKKFNVQISGVRYSGGYCNSRINECLDLDLACFIFEWCASLAKSQLEEMVPLLRIPRQKFFMSSYRKN